MSRRRVLYILVSAILAAYMGGCSNGECYDNHSALPLASFFNAATLQPVAVQALEIYGVGAPGDSVLYTPQSISEAYLPFRIWEEETQYVFLYTSLVPEEDRDDVSIIPRDTVTFRYTPKEWFVSPDCGAMYFYEMKSAEHTSVLIDSISFNTTITNENASNIKIFFREAINPTSQ